MLQRPWCRRTRAWQTSEPTTATSASTCCKRAFPRTSSPGDLRKGPLENARRNARRSARRTPGCFSCSDGLEKIAPEEIDCAVLAGMGGDLIVRILSACSWRARESLTLVLQPQSAGNVLRRWLYSEGLELLREEPVQDGSFLYTVMQLHAGSPAPLTPGQEYASPALLQSGNPLVGAYLARVETALIATVEGLTGAEKQRPSVLPTSRRHCTKFRK